MGLILTKDRNIHEKATKNYVIKAPELEPTSRDDLAHDFQSSNKMKDDFEYANIESQINGKVKSIEKSFGEAKKQVPKITSLNTINLNPEQKNLHHFMSNHPFRDTPQAPDVDADMIENLGKATSKSNMGNSQWKVNYENGAEYVGSIVEDSNSPNFEQPISKGKFKFPNGDEYEGNLGVRADGVYRHRNGVVYEGQFYNLKKSGNGKQTFPSGDVYIGKFFKNKYHGKGQLYFSNEESYKGNFLNGLREHIGTYSYPSGEKVVGDWTEDMLHGRGEYEFTNGSKMRSGFENSQIKLG